jgi:2-C-methyl-D-erythritol 4-phosphate cytidylyltransferase
MSALALVPAAGSGSRMASATPKQYLDLLGQPLIAHTLRALLSAARLAQVVVVISPEDEWWESYDWSDLLGESFARLLVLRVGGDSRAQSVLNGLAALPPSDTWVLVHDAARPCITSQQVDSMVAQLEYDAVGGILAVPVADTLKVSTEEQSIARTTPRAGLWQAQTPQMFRQQELLTALQAALPEHVADITDEASALERLGKTPKLIMGSPWNLKVTYPQDLILAGLLLKAEPI